ncbi:MAG: SUMF1/EgtB/PvdO family nonheme iron enzyme [Burkholderiales bacterium]|nr:SUMF1/EgtB/PvdO family nonheme iron enzyme [Burkholderiales bacterium]MDR4515979.1 SUMF1/EgtB/PvdO family nonheme iron enzyme [Nitrosomonas sp.]
MSAIFINYRREDSEAYAGRIYDRLKVHFGSEKIFKDIEHIAPGDIFAEVIQEKLDTVKVALVLIGKDWLDTRDKNGQRRLDDPDDWVRLEIATLLSRNIRIIPIQVGGAVLPEIEELPEPIVALRKRSALEISGARFDDDIVKLIKVLEIKEGIKALPKPKKANSNAYILAGGLFAAVIAVVVVMRTFLDNPINQMTNGGDEFVHSDEGDNVTVNADIFHGNGDINVRDTDISTIKSEGITHEKYQYASKIQETETYAKLNQDQSPFRDCSVCPEMVKLEFEPFHMGSNTGNHNESPMRKVNLSGQFALSINEVTWSEWNLCVADGYCSQLSAEQSDSKKPVSGVSWKEANSYTRWLSYKTNYTYRLPSEVEWEFAARTDDDSSGLQHMIGNVWEWVADCGLPYEGEVQTTSPVKDPEGCVQRVLRGGSWKNNLMEVTASSRKIVPLTARASDYGFRVARSM